MVIGASLGTLIYLKYNCTRDSAFISFDIMSSFFVKNLIERFDIRLEAYYEKMIVSSSYD